MKLIGDNVGRRLISYRNPNLGVPTQQAVVTAEPIVIDADGAGVQSSGMPSFNVGTGFYLGMANGVPVFAVGSSDQGMSWDGTTLNVTGVLEALSAIISGDVEIGEGGEVRSGMTAFNSGTGFWLGTDGSGNPQFALVDQFNNYIIYDGSTASPLSISSTALIQALSSLQTDDAGWSQSAVWGSITGLPTTLAGFGITDAQPLIADAAGTGYVLKRDNGGAIYSTPQYDYTNNYAYQELSQISVNSTSQTVWGNTLVLPNPGTAVSFMAEINGYVDFDTANSVIILVVEYSVDGGATFNSPNAVRCINNSTSSPSPISASVGFTNVTPTGDIWVRSRARLVAGSANTFLKDGVLRARVIPYSSFTALGNLVASVPGTAAMSCSALYPITSCTTNGTVTCTVTTGIPPFTYSWTKVSGTGSIASGGATATVTLTDTETTADGGATHTTTVKCTVTDAQTYATTAGTRASGTATLTIGAHFIPVGASVTVSGCTPTAYNGTFTVTGVTATTISYALTGTTSITVNGTVNNVNVTTGNCVMTGTFTRTYNPITANTTVTSGSCSGCSTFGCTCTASGTAKANATGGNGSYTYSWTVTSGPGSITAGASSRTCTVSSTESSSTPHSSNTVVQCSVNDTASTGAVLTSGTVTLSFSGSSPH
jgi:hypothetical protein